MGHRHYGKEKIISLSKDNGLNIQQIEIKGGWWEIVSINDLYISKWILRRKPLFNGILERGQNKEYLSKNGFSTIFKDKKAEN